MPEEAKSKAVEALEIGSPEDALAAISRLLAVTEATLERRAQLEHALQSRVVIEQAKGILAERFGLDVEEAFAVLRRGARTNRVKLRDLATRVVTEPETPPEISAALAASQA